MLMKQFISRVTANTRLAEGYYELIFPWHIDAGHPLPGQFFSIRVADSTVPLLRRPFAFAGFNPATSSAAMIYQVRGKGTEILKNRQPDEELDLAGPFGNAFPLPGDKKLNLIVAGGIGLGPMLFLAGQMKAEKLPCQFIYGCRSSSFIPGLREFNNLQPVICTDDGTEGFEGTAVDYLRSIKTDDLRLYACGPSPMLRGCHLFAESHNTECLVSMEEIMACGIGACMGCMVKTRTGLARVCKEGAVFNSRDLIWD